MLFSRFLINGLAELNVDIDALEEGKTDIAESWALALEKSNTA